MVTATNPCGLLSGKNFCEERCIWEEYQSGLKSFVEKKKFFLPLFLKERNFTSSEMKQSFPTGDGLYVYQRFVLNIC